MRTIQFRDALREAMNEEMRRDDRVFLMGEEVAEYNGAYKVSQGMLDEFGADRIIDTPIAELGFTGIGVGAAMNGLRPIVEFMTWNFAILAADQIINSAAKMLQMSGGQYNVPIVFRGGNGTAGQLAATHSQSFEAFYAHVPGLKVLTPSNPADAKGLLRSAIADDDPVIYLENKKITFRKGEVPEGDYRIALGEASVARSGSDVSLITYSVMAQHALEAAQVLFEEHSVEAEVVDLRTLVPLDIESVLTSVAKTRRAVICHEAWTFGGFGAEISSQINEHLFGELAAPVVRVGARSAPIPFSPPLERELVPEASEVVEAVLRTVKL